MFIQNVHNWQVDTDIMGTSGGGNAGEAADVPNYGSAVAAGVGMALEGHHYDEKITKYREALSDNFENAIRWEREGCPRV